MITIARTLLLYACIDVCVTSTESADFSRMQDELLAYIIFFRSASNQATVEEEVDLQS